ncbi:MAG: hypothetical protein AAB263_13600 [Planctomycetota bacterium]
MRHVFHSIAILALFANVMSAVEFTTKTLETEIGVMKTKLEKITAESAKDFITSYVDPDDLEKLKKDGGVEKIAPEFVSGGKAAELLKVLKSIDLAKAVVDDKEKTISFELTKKDGEKEIARGKITFTFKKDSWRLKN